MSAAATPHIPRAPYLPVVGGLLHYLRNPLSYLEHAAKLGDIVEIRLFRQRAILLSDPAAIEQVLLKSASHFQKDAFLRALKRLLGEGLLTSEGEFWKRQRRLIQPAFHRDKIASYADIMTHHTTRVVDGFVDGAAVDVHQVMMGLTAEIVTKCLFGTSAGDTSEVEECLALVMKRSSNPFLVLVPILEKLPLPINRRFREVTARLDAIVRGFIAQRRALGPDAKVNDLLTMLLEAKDEDGTHMSDQQVRDEVLVLFLAGHETTALAMSWTFYELSKNPAVEAKLQNELDRVLGGRVPTFADLPRLEYTARVVQESLRLHPPAWSTGRESIDTVELAGQRLPPGTWIWIVPYTLHRDARWFDEPRAFRPERWEDGLAKRLPKFAYMPFGGGPRICIGNQFALMESALLLATIAQRYSLRMVPGHRVVADPAITLRLKHGLAMTLHKRVLMQSQPAAARQA